MPTVVERHNSRALSADPTNPGSTFRYFVYGAANEADAYDAVDAEAPVSYDPPFGGPAFVPKAPQFEPLGGGCWDVVVTYGLREGQEVEAQTGGGSGEEPLGPEWSGSIGGGTEKITQSIRTVTSVRAGGDPATDRKQAINASSTGVEGVDIVGPKFEFQVSIRTPAIYPSYLKRLAKLAGTINDAPFLGFQAWELLYLGAEWSNRGQEGWSFTHKFAASPTLTDVDVGNGIVIPFKAGWDYLWVSYEPTADPAAGVYPKPLEAYVEEVYRESDFTLIGIGGG